MAGVTAYIIVPFVALLVSGLTLFSGFGLGTLLLPAFALFFPLGTAVAATAVVHLANNLFKLALLWRLADWGVVLRFALPASLASVLGAVLLAYLSRLPVLIRYELGGVREVTLAKLAIGTLIAAFAGLELIPSMEERLQFRRGLLPVGATLSGFFGGLSGHQGALRSAVLIRCGLDKEAFIATGVICAVAVDCFRVAGYGIAMRGEFEQAAASGAAGLVLAGCLAAFAGALAGVRLMKKVTMRAVRNLVGGMLLGLALALITGLL